MSTNTDESRSAVSANSLPQFMREAPVSAEIEEKTSWLNNNLHKLMIGVSVIWFAIVLIYITQFFGWDNLFLMMPDEFGGFLAGITLPLAIIWVVMAYIDRGTSFKQEAKFLRAYMNQLVYPEDGAPQTAKAMADAIRSQVVELQEVSKMATLYTAKIKDEIKENINDFSKLVATLDNYSSKTIVELSDGIKYLTQNFDSIINKAQNSAETFKVLNREFASGAGDIELNLNSLLEMLIPKIKEVKTSAELLHNISDSSNHDIVRANEMLRKFNDETTANLNVMIEALSSHSQNLQEISVSAITNCGMLKDAIAQEVKNMAEKLENNTDKLEKAISAGGSVMRGKIDELSKHASEQLNVINQQINKGLGSLDNSIEQQIKRVNVAISKNSHDVAGLMNSLDKQVAGVNKKLADSGAVLAQELDKLMIRSNNLQDSISTQISNLNNVSDQAIVSIQKFDATLENNIVEMQAKSQQATADIIAYIENVAIETEKLKQLSDDAIKDAEQVGESIQNKRQEIREIVDEVTDQLRGVSKEIDTSADNLRNKSSDSAKLMADTADNMKHYSNILTEATAVVTAQNQVSESSLAQQHKNITASASRVEEIKSELKHQLDELSSASAQLEKDANSTVQDLREGLSNMLGICNEVINKSKAINDNLSEQSNQFDTSANKTLAKMTQFETVLNNQNQNIELLGQNISERAANIDTILSKQNKLVNETTLNTLDNFRRVAEDFDAQSKSLHEISRATAEYTSEVAANFNEKAAVLNTIFKQQENEFYSFCDKISDNAESMSDALKKQVEIIEQSANKVFSRMVMLEEDTSRHTEAVVTNSHRSIDRLNEIESLIDSKNSSIKKIVDNIYENLGDVSNKLQERASDLMDVAKNIDEKGKGVANSLSESCQKVRLAETELYNTSSNISKLLEEQAKNIDLAAGKVQVQNEDINRMLANQVENITEVANTLATQSRLGEASLAQQYKYLSDAATSVAQKMKEINEGFKNNTDNIFETSTKLAYEFDVLGDRLIKAGEDISKTSKNSMKNIDQVSLLLTQNSEDLDVAVKNSVEKIGSIFGEYEKYIAGFNTVTAETSTGVMEINQLISAQSNKMIQISEDTKKLVECFDTVLNDTSNQLAERANQAYDKVKGLGNDLKNLGIQMEEAAKISVAHISNSGDKLRASIGEIAANAERISHDILGSGEVFIKQSGALVAATDDTIEKVNSAMGSLLEASKDFSLNGESIIKDALRFNEIISSQIKELNEQTHKADSTLKNLTTSYQGIQIEGFLSQAGSIIEKLESISVDINRVFNPKDEEDLWKRFYNGDTAVFVRNLAKNITKTQVSTVRKEFEKNHEFRVQVNAYLQEFEMLINAAKTHEHSGLLLSVISGADIGKLYYVLAKIMDKLE